MLHQSHPNPLHAGELRTMNRQSTLANASTFEKYKKPTRREKFLAEMEQVVPWKGLNALIEPFYPKAGKGRPPVGLERMLRIHFLQSWFNLSDPAAEEVLYDIESMRRFVGIDLGNEPVPDETTICKFRHLLETHGLGERIFQEVDAHLEEKGLRLSEGTIMDVTIINAPSSTKNREKKRDPDMHSTKKGNQYSIGMKIHVEPDRESKTLHSLVTTPANVLMIRAWWSGSCTVRKTSSSANLPTWERRKRSGRRFLRRWT